MSSNDGTQPQNVRQLVIALITALMGGFPLTTEMRTGFGLTTEAHHRALHHALIFASNTQSLATISAELDAAMGNGEKITAFVRKYAPWITEIAFDNATEPRDVRPLVKKLVELLVLDLPLTPAMIVDFGLSTDDHRRALLDAIEEACETPGALPIISAELDEALGDGTKITAFVHKYAPWHAEITFSAQPLNP
jgi:hypothetical protein